FFFQAEDGIRDPLVTGVQTCALPISKVTIISPKLTDDLKRLASSATILHRGRSFKMSDVEGGIWLVMNTVRNDEVLSRDLFKARSEEHTSELQSRVDLVCRLLLEKKK